MNASEKQLLRELAKRYAELAALPVQNERIQRARDINDLKPRRPIVWLHELPWHEMDIEGELKAVCEDPFARQMEWYFRSSFYRWKYIQADTVLEDHFPISKEFSSTGMGIETEEKQLATDDKNHIVSHSYYDQLDTMDKVNALRLPALRAEPEKDAERLDFANDILDGILPVKLRGGHMYSAPWDRIPRHRGVMQVMTDLVEEPELMHATIKKFADAGYSHMKQMEALGLLESEPMELHCTPSYVSGLAGEGSPVKLKNTWIRCTAQMFGDVSPAMWDEFELQYQKPLMEECGLVYYGCCEALDNKIPLLKTIPNLRKIGVPPWANPERCAEQIGRDYVYAYKPNPAHVSGRFNGEAVKNELVRVVEACHKHGCAYEAVLKDISTCTYKPGNIIEWVKTVGDVLDAYY